MNTTAKLLCLLTLLTSFLVPARAASPEYINYQGLLNGANGLPLPTGNYTLEFNIYDQANLGGKQWGPFLFDGGAGNGHGPLVSVANGRFNVIIGPRDTTGGSVTNAFGTATRFVEVKVNNGSPILPRQQFLSTPYAFKANNADQAAVATLATVATSVSDVNVAYRNTANTFTGDQTVNGNATVSGNVGIGAVPPIAKLDVAGDVRGRALLRSGSETGTSQAPSPAGLVIRRINSTSSTAGQVVARTDQLTLERDGTVSGLLIRYPANVTKQTVMVRYMNNDGNSYSSYATLDSSIYGAAAGTVALTSNFPGNVIDWEITFGDMTYSGLGHYTHVHLTRYSVDSQVGSIPAVRNWIGTLTSTFNQ
jgi:hypothetical protein